MFKYVLYVRTSIRSVQQESERRGDLRTIFIRILVSGLYGCYTLYSSVCHLPTQRVVYGLTSSYCSDRNSSAVQCSAEQCRARHILYIITISPLNFPSGSVYRHNKEKKGQTRAEATLRLSHRSTKIMAFSSRMVSHRRGIFPMASTSVDQDRAEQNRRVANNLSLPLAL